MTSSLLSLHVIFTVTVQTPYKQVMQLLENKDVEGAKKFTINMDKPEFLPFALEMYHKHVSTKTSTNLKALKKLVTTAGFTCQPNNWSPLWQTFWRGVKPFLQSALCSWHLCRYQQSPIQCNFCECVLLFGFQHGYCQKCNHCMH